MQPEASADGLADLYFHEALYFAAVTITTVGYGKQHAALKPVRLAARYRDVRHAHKQLGFSITPFLSGVRCVDGSPVATAATSSLPRA